MYTYTVNTINIKAQKESTATRNIHFLRFAWLSRDKRQKLNVIETQYAGMTQFIAISRGDRRLVPSTCLSCRAS